MKTVLKFLAKRIKFRPARFLIGCIYGNLALYGYIETVRIAVDISRKK